MIWFMLVHGTLPLYPQVLYELGDLVIPQFIRAVFSRKAGRRPEMEKALEVIQLQAAQNHELAKLIVQKDGKTEDQLFALVDKLTSQNSKALAEIAAPVGRSVKQVEHFAKTPNPYIIDEPVAEAFRAQEEVQVGDQETLRGTLFAVDKDARTCKLKRPDSKKMLRCKITDPALLEPNNIYTDTLNKVLPVEVTGKPVIKEGKLSTFYISHGKRI